MYNNLTDAEYWQIADRMISRLTLPEAYMEKVYAWRAANDRNLLGLWEIYDEVLALRIELEEPMRALQEYKIPNLAFKECDDKTMFCLKKAPPKLPNWQDYIVKAKTGKDVAFFLHFLHDYEQTLNSRATRFAERYEMESFFADIKMAIVEALWKGFLTYDVSSEVPFLTYCARDVKDEMHELARQLGNGFTSKNLTSYYRLRRIAHLWLNRGEQSTEAFIAETAQAMKLSEKTVAKYLEEAEARKRFIDYYSAKDDDDETDSVEDYISDNEPSPDILVPKMMDTEALKEAIQSLSDQEIALLEGRFGFCSECLHNKAPASFDDLADLCQMTTEEGVEKAFLRAFEALLRALAERDYCHAVTIDKAPQSPKNDELRYFYQPDFMGEFGEIVFDLRRPAMENYSIVKNAEMDITGIYAEQAARIVAKLQREEWRLINEGSKRSDAQKVYVKHKVQGIRNEWIPNVKKSAEKSADAKP